MSNSIHKDLELQEAYAHEIGIKSRETSPLELYNAGWRFNTNPTQEKARRSTAIYILMDGERGSGKSTVGLSMLVEYCFLNPDAFCVILVKTVGQAKEGGAWEKLYTEVLPAWRDGNFDRDGNRIDKGIGLQFTEPRPDVQTKNPHIWIENTSGKMSSMIMLLSLPVAKQVKSKVKGREPAMIMVDEAQTLDEDPFQYLLQQLGRRRGMKMKQKIVFCANPEGPSHWLYHRFFIHPIDQGTGEWDKRYARFHIPVAENLHNLPESYYEDYVLPAVKGDPIEEARMVRGEWIDRPSGEGLFAGAFKEEIHVWGDLQKGQGILPAPGFLVFLSYDLGAAHTSIHFCQIIPTRDKLIRVVFDEMDYVGTYVPYSKLVPKIIDRMKYWDERMKTQFKWNHISDDSAFNQYRAAEGSFDAWDVEELSRNYCAKKSIDERYIIKMKAAPKGKMSREARARMVYDGFEEEDILVSATCPHTVQMLSLIEQDEGSAMAPRKDGKLDHKFDSFSYGFFYHSVGRGRFNVRTGPVVRPEIYTLN